MASAYLARPRCEKRGCLLRPTVLETLPRPAFLATCFSPECGLAVAWTGDAGMLTAPSQKQDRLSLSRPGLPVWTLEPWHVCLVLLIASALASAAGQHRLRQGHCGPWQPAVTCRWVRPEDGGLEGVTRPPLLPLPVAPGGDPAPWFSQQQRRVGYKAGSHWKGGQHGIPPRFRQGFHERPQTGD